MGPLCHLSMMQTLQHSIQPRIYDLTGKYLTHFTNILKIEMTKSLMIIVRCERTYTLKSFQLAYKILSKFSEFLPVLLGCNQSVQHKTNLYSPVLILYKHFMYYTSSHCNKLYWTLTNIQHSHNKWETSLVHSKLWVHLVTYFLVNGKYTHLILVSCIW